LTPDSMEALKNMNIAYKLTFGVCDPGSQCDISLELTTPPSSLAPSSIPTSLTNITIFAQYPYNTTTFKYTDRATLLVNITDACVVRRSLLESTTSSGPSPVQFEYGESILMSTLLNLTNVDATGCGVSPFAVSSVFTVSVSPSWSVSLFPLFTELSQADSNGYPINNVSLNTPATFTIPQQQSLLLTVTLNVSGGVFPGQYSIDINAVTPAQKEHATSIRLMFEITSDPPRPAWDLSAYEIRTKLAGAIGHDIQWRACEVAGECSCPCTYQVFINGDLKATVSDALYQYRYSMAQAGVTTVAEVVVVDRFGRQSASDGACESYITFVPSDSPYAHLFIFLVIVAVLIFPAILILLEWLRHTGRLPMSNVDFDHPNEIDNPNEVELQVMETSNP